MLPPTTQTFQPRTMLYFAQDTVMKPCTVQIRSTLLMNSQLSPHPMLSVRPPLACL